MRIAHLCLSCFYIDGRSYQENDLVREHVAQGHDVLVVASTETIDSNGKLNYLEPSEYMGTDGALVKRLGYASWLPHAIGKKLRIHGGVRKILDDFRPEAILFHGACGWEIRTAAAYKDDNPSARFFVDSHEDMNNSATNFVSRELLHRRYYGPVLRSCLTSIEKILCISTETIEFVEQMYKIDRSQLEFYPLGGFPKEGTEYDAMRQAARAEMNLAPHHIMILQSGKQTARKKLLESLAAFTGTPGDHLRLVIAGMLADEIAEEAKALIASDNRIVFVGWKSRGELDALLCAADIYLQPGTQSATMQHSLCNQCAVILDDCPAHRVYKDDNGWFVSDQSGLVQAFAEVGAADLESMKIRSLGVAKRLLDYTVLAKRVL